MESIRSRDQFQVRGKINVRRQTWGGKEFSLSLFLLSLFLYTKINSPSLLQGVRVLTQPGSRSRTPRICETYSSYQQSLGKHRKPMEDHGVANRFC